MGSDVWIDPYGPGRCNTTPPAATNSCVFDPPKGDRHRRLGDLEIEDFAPGVDEIAFDGNV
jgi:hypothetical protein